MKKYPMKKRAFTLIELLVVISIIAMLIAILLPALAAARTSAQMTQSMSQIRQIELGLTMYAGDNNAMLPWARRDNITPYIYWNTRLVKGGYISDPLKMFWSPGRNTSFIQKYRDDHPNQTPKQVFKNTPVIYATGYSANLQGAMTRSKWKQYGYHRIRIGQPGVPTSKLMVLTEGYSTNWWTDNHWDGQYGITVRSANAGLFTYDGNVVTSYMDGHAKAVKSKVLGWDAKAPHIGDWIAGYDKTKAPWFYRRFIFR